MLFGLKNVGATYQRAMVALFHDMMHKEIEVYVDNMIAKSKTPEQHIEDLRKLFIRLQKYRLRLNPAKCTFGVKTMKLLGFVVNERGIEVDPDKVKAMREMLVSKTESEIQGFLGRVNFIARSFERNKNSNRTRNAKRLSRRLNGDLENPLVLVPTVPGKPLILYLTVLEESMGYMLGQRDATGKKEQFGLPKGSDNTCCLIPTLRGWIARCQMAFSEYDIVYVNQKAVKGSTLWTMWFDGIGVVLASPTDHCFPFSTKLGFDYTNNMTEYEACTMGLMMALEHQVKKLKVFKDSALVIFQLRGEWET
ncbi:Retrovirus-related Pol polyprotein from transposon 17.6, partial [Mucuna pruriens]